MYGYFVCMYVSVPCACLIPLEVRRGIQIPWVTVSCELPRGWWKSRPGLLEKQSEFLITEPSPGFHTAGMAPSAHQTLAFLYMCWYVCPFFIPLLPQSCFGACLEVDIQSSMALNSIFLLHPILELQTHTTHLPLLLVLNKYSCYNKTKNLSFKTAIFEIQKPYYHPTNLSWKLANVPICFKPRTGEP